MKSRSRVLLISAIFTSILLNSNKMVLVKGQEGNAYFTKVEGHPKSKIYQSSGNVWNFSARFTVYNVNCTVDDSGRAWFFIKIYKNDELWWNEYNDTTYKVWHCDEGYEVQRPPPPNFFIFTIPTWQGPNVYDFKTELYWDDNGTLHLLDTTSFSVTCVLTVHSFNITVVSYFFVYSLATFLLLFYLLITRPYKFWT